MDEKYHLYIYFFNLKLALAPTHTFTILSPFLELLTYLGPFADWVAKTGYILESACIEKKSNRMHLDL